MRNLLLILILSPILGCGHDNPGENHGDLLLTTSGLTLVQDEHTAGWGRADCFTCHLPKNLHREDRISSIELDLDAIDDLVNAQGEASCASCHGANGL